LALAVAITTIVGGLGMGVAAVRLGPLFGWGPLSFRGGGIASVTSPLPLGTPPSVPPVQLVSLLLPDFFVANGQYWGWWPRWEGFVYTGIAPLALALAAIVLGRRRLTAFFVGVAVFSIVLALGEYSPFGLHRFLGTLPGSLASVAPSWLSSVFALAVAGLAGLGTDALSRAFAPASTSRITREGRIRPLLARVYLLMLQLLTAVLPLALMLAGAYVGGHKDAVAAWLQATFVQARGVGLSPSVEQLPGLLAASLGATQPSTLRQIALLCATTAVLLLWDRLRWPAPLWKAALVALVAVDLIGFAQVA
jgi:hypothetical protein